MKTVSEPAQPSPGVEEEIYEAFFLFVSFKPPFNL